MSLSVAIGRPLDEIKEMPAEEYHVWRAWLAHNPPDGVQFLLAQLCAMFCNAHRGKEHAPVGVYDFAPWLEDPHVRQERLEKQRLDILRAQSLAVKEIYQSQKARENGRQ